MELVNPLSSFQWSEPLDIHGVPMMGIAEKQGWAFSRHGWLSAREYPEWNADALGRDVRRAMRPRSLPTLEAARTSFAERDPRAFPRYFIIEPINICNRACPFCSITVMERYDAAGKPIRGMMKWEVFMRLMKECRGHDVYGMSLYQLGEPFLWRGIDSLGDRVDIADMVNAAKYVGGFRAVNISTNGDVANLDCVLGSELDDLIISIDGTTAEVYNANRPATNKNEPDPFGSTIRRVQDFLHEKAAMTSGKPWVRLQIINKENTRDQVLDFIRTWIEVPGVDDVLVKNLDSMRPWLGSSVVADAEDAVKAERLGAMPCQHIYAVGSMVVDGSFTACCHDAKTELVDTVVVDGRRERTSILNSTFADWWNGRFMNGLRDDHNAGNFRTPCLECRERDTWLG